MSRTRRTIQSAIARTDAFRLEPLEHRCLLAIYVGTPDLAPPEQTAVPITRLQGGAGAFSSVAAIGVASQPRAPINFTRGNYSLTGVGIGIGGNSDQFTFASMPATQDGSIVVRVASITGSASTARAGIMFRSSLAASAAFAALTLGASGGVSFIRRSADGAATSQSFIPNVPMTSYLKLTREGNAVSAFYSSDGIAWTQAGTNVTVALGADPRVGIASTSGSASASTTAIFSNVSLLLPIGSEASDLTGSSAGSYAVYKPSTNRYTLAGAGLDNGDSIGFIHRPTLGSGSVLATVDRFIDSPATSSAGLALRGSAAANAPFASIHVTPAGVVKFQWRAATGGAVSSVTDPGSSSPVSLRLERDGNTVRAFRSSDRINWAQVGSAQSISFASSRALAGMSILSNVPASLATTEISGFTQLSGEGSAVDIGNAVTAGSLLFDTVRNTHAMIGRGSGVGSTDQLTLATRPMAGDGDVVAYLSGFVPGNASARAGLVIRASTAANSAFIGIFRAASGLIVQSRSAAGGSLSNVHVPSVNGSVSLKLSRVGNVITARYSVDGSTWVAVGAGITVSLGASPVAGMALASGTQSDFVPASFTGFAVGTKLGSGAGLFTPADEAFLNDLEARSVSFFWSETNPNTGLVPDGSSASGGNPSSASSIASVGFGLSALAIADERGFLTHAEAYTRVLTTLNFLHTTAAHVNGFFYHFMNPSTGARAGNSELSPMDSALLMAGVIDVGEHWAGTPIETVANQLFDRVNWPWMQKPNGQFYGHWKPENGFEYGYGDFSEAVLIYLLGLGSHTHPTSSASWSSWSRTPVINYGGSTFVTAQTRALFTTQYPMGWFDLRGKTDAFGLNYFENAQRATLAQRTMGINLSNVYPQWGANVWGWTAADGPNGYTVWGGPPPTGNIDGTVVPTAPGGSLAFTPRQSVDALRHLQSTYPTTYRRYGFVDAFNPQTNWTSSIVLGIDVGMMLLAAENARSGAVWRRFTQNPVAQSAMSRAFGSASTPADADHVGEPAVPGSAVQAVADAASSRRRGIASDLFADTAISALA